ncbi:ABC transporter ATP-binding protein [Polynucleobacter sp. AP-Reno-20A-A9]|uniref:ABC transporter ATP-binding protein n=1 Tax=Polynucleobacter sp. AP-Reno-20A-A9 TaxID=2576925 RepID=UPI001C0E0781|nr:ABC transporter ATP-binding protein [Polynucleobacter sp. AP-Reno-20A-A9]MBU3628455.1 ABC transporter ATP-binding protein [Polynucleobacter sp. AP-Reno-20A-A9]
MLKVKLSQINPNPLQLNIECIPGELHALVGPSGSGKTTALRTIAGLNNADTGKIECDGKLWFEANEVNGITTSLSPANRSCGFLFQQYALFPHLTALENVCIPLHNSVNGLANRNALAQQWLDRMGIGELAKRMPSQLSGGQQQRVALARALARSPKILLLDEPFSAIDAPTRQGLYKTLAELRKDLNIPILLVTHDLREADLLADRITVIDQGVGLQTAPPQVLFERPRNSRVAELVGISNKFEGVFSAGKLSWNGCQRIFNVVDKGKIPPNTPVAWVIPADGISLHVTSSPTSIEAQVEQISAIGQIAVIQLRTSEGNHAITWEASAAEVKRLVLDAGKEAHLEIDSSKIHIMPLRPINDPRRFAN